MSDPLPRVVAAHAKVNLGLAVLARETSGYHQIETIFCALELADDIAIRAGGAGIRLEVAAPTERPGPPPDLGPDEANLAVRAARLFFDRTGLEAAAAVRLVKRIPVGGGMGGGSTDAATVLATLNRMNGAPLGAPALLSLAASVGSDVPFFLAPSPLARAWGRGSRILPLAPLPPAPVLLLVPPVGVATAEAYADLAAVRPPDYAASAAILPPEPRGWAELADLSNDFEPVVFRRHPRLGQMLKALEASGALLARMTGSGSALFGIYPDDAAAARARADLAAAYADADVVLTRTLDAWPGAGKPSGAT